MEEGTSIVSTKEYIQLIEFRKSMEKEFVEFSYCGHRRKYAYSKDDFLNEHKETLERMKKSLNDKSNDIERLTNQIVDIIVEKEKIKNENLELKSIPYFKWNTFYRGAIFGIGISMIMYVIIYSIIQINK